MCSVRVYVGGEDESRLDNIDTIVKIGAGGVEIVVVAA